MSLTLDDLRILVCPVCGGRLRCGTRPADGHTLDDGFLDCVQCGRPWPVRHGVAALLDDEQVRGMDRWLRPVYDLVAPLHDLGVTVGLPLMQFPDPGGSRSRYMQRIGLGDLRARPAGPPLRVLEVGIGSGGNLPLIERALPAGLAVEIWGVDYSKVMIDQCRRRLPWYTTRPVRLLLADAHRLPFEDDSFDRVFHVGGINGYRRPKVALEEMARVARADTPIVVVDEQLDPERMHLPQHYLSFWALTWFDPDPAPPIDHLPAAATGVDVSRVSRFYYCLTFRMPPKATSKEKGDPTMPASDGQLDAKGLSAIRDAYDSTKMLQFLREGFEKGYPETIPWLDALTNSFNVDVPEECPSTPRTKLSEVDRERCIITILASRGGGGVLAIHIYMAIALGVEIDEIKHILFLTGVYSGMSSFAKGMATLGATLEVLGGQVAAKDLAPRAVGTAILKALGT